MAKKKLAPMSDTDLLNWFEREGGIACAALINDDNGHWAVSTTGMQNAVCGKRAADVQTTFFVEAKEWKKSVREAILAFKASCEEEK